MRRPFFLKIFGWHLVIILAISLLIPVFAFRTIRSHFIDNQAHDLENLAQALKLMILPLADPARQEELDNFVKDFGKRIRTRITVIDSEGLVLADSEEDPKRMENHRYRPELYKALSGQPGRSVRFSNTVKQDMLYVSIPLEKEGRIVGALRVSLFLKDIQHLLSAVKKDIVITVIILILLALVVAFLVSRGLIKPIKDLIGGSRQVASGDFSTRVYPRTNDELKDLAESFNGMTEEIKRLFEDLTRRKEELESILSSIQEGLVVLDRQDKIILANQSFKRIVRNDLVEGKYYWEAARSTRFVDLVRRTREGKRSLQEEFELNEKDFLCSASYLPSSESIIITAHDLSEVRRLEKVKRDLVLNVSHELRTPLTAIKGFVETLECEAPEKDRYFLGIIKRNTDRLIKIVEDLLLLAELEEKGIVIQAERVDLRALTENIIKIFELRAKEKELTLELLADPELPLITADPFALEQMFINLIDNSLKYTDRGAVRISLKRKFDDILIEIEDTGIGIPAEHLDRIFERFYVADKSRSKKLGGTGLGLAIVKHIVLAHQGRISVRSEPGIGTTFSIILPIDAR
jgi:two-component system phosphate regulon sensor histidine kinase PhoR